MAKSLPALSAEDRELWNALKKEVRPMHVVGTLPTKTVAPEVKQSADRIKKPSKTPTENLIWQAPGSFAKTLASTPLRPKSPQDMREKRSGGLDRANADKLRRGKMPIEGTIDLHGMTQEKAAGALERFVLSAARAGKRNLLVITGKGKQSGGRGVLRTRVPEWLSQDPLNIHVLAFSYANRRDGEQGALYVLLRRTRG